MMKRAILSLSLSLGGAAVVGVLLAASGIPADASEPDRGYAIYAERDAQDQGFGDQRVKLRMTLRSPGGRTATRELTLSEAEGKGGRGDKTLIVFDAPADIAGTRAPDPRAGRLAR